jgi:hypothetical protein
MTATGFQATYFVKGAGGTVGEIVVSVDAPEPDEEGGWFCRVTATFLTGPIRYGGPTPEIALYNAFETMQRWVEGDFGTLRDADGRPTRLPVPPLPKRPG